MPTRLCAPNKWHATVAPFILFVLHCFAIGNAQDAMKYIICWTSSKRFDFGLKMALLQKNVSEPRIHVTPGAFRTFCSWSSGTPRLVKTALRDASCWEHGESSASSEIPQDAHVVAWEAYSNFLSYDMIARMGQLECNVQTTTHRHGQHVKHLTLALDATVLPRESSAPSMFGSSVANRSWWEGLSANKPQMFKISTSLLRITFQASKEELYWDISRPCPLSVEFEELEG